MKRSKIDSDDDLAFSDEGTSDSDNRNADEEETLGRTRNIFKKKYIQKPRKAWSLDPHLKDWIIVDANEVQCRFCDRILNVKFSSLKAHGYSQKHLRAERKYKERAKLNENENKDIFSKNLISEFEYDETADAPIMSECEKDDETADATMSECDKEDKSISKIQDANELNNTTNGSSKKKTSKRRCTEEEVFENTCDKDDLMAMRIAIEKDKVKAIGDMSKQISSAIRYLADSIRLTIQNNNFSKNDKI